LQATGQLRLFVLYGLCQAEKPTRISYGSDHDYLQQQLNTFLLNNYFLKRKTSFFFFGKWNKVLFTKKIAKTNQLEKRPHI
jgi:hypothetical protein